MASSDVSDILVDGLRRLEYQSYDSADMALVNGERRLRRIRSKGKVQVLARALHEDPLEGTLGIADTRWATHGEHSEHRHICRERIALVHNGIIENHQKLQTRQEAQGFRFTFSIDTEVIVHQVTHYCDGGDSLLEAVRRTTADLEGSFALGVIDIAEPGRMVPARHGSPLVIGLGEDRDFIASDVAALLPATRRFIIPRIWSDGVRRNKGVWS